MNQDAVNQRHQHGGSALRRFHTSSITQFRSVVPVVTVCFISFNPQKRVLLALNDFGVAVAELEVFRLINDAADEVLVKPSLSFWYRSIFSILAI